MAGVVDALRAEPAVCRELAELADALEERARVLTRPSELAAEVSLHVHATYGRGEVLVALGDRVLGDGTAHREGVKYVKPYELDVLFVTLEKSERDYSPTTRYRDYVVSRDLFHWESQSGTTRRSPTGRRYLDGTSTVLLFVRRTRRDASGRAPDDDVLALAASEGAVLLTQDRVSASSSTGRDRQVPAFYSSVLQARHRTARLVSSSRLSKIMDPSSPPRSPFSIWHG